MGKKLILGSVFVVIGVFAGFAVSHAQFGGQFVPTSSAPPGYSSPGVHVPAHVVGDDIEQEIRNLYSHLQAEKQSNETDAAILAQHAGLLNALTRYMAVQRMTRAIADFELIIKEMPESDEAKKAAAAIEALKTNESTRQPIPQVAPASPPRGA